MEFVAGMVTGIVGTLAVLLVVLLLPDVMKSSIDMED